MPKRKTIVVPCIEKIWLYVSGASRSLFGLMSCVRISIANETADQEEARAP